MRSLREPYLIPIPYSLIPIPYSLFPIPYSLKPKIPAIPFEDYVVSISYKLYTAGADNAFTGLFKLANPSAESVLFERRCTKVLRARKNA